MVSDQNSVSRSNGIVVEGFTHRQVVDLIRAGGDTLTLTIISVSQEEAERLEPSEEAGFVDVKLEFMENC